MRAVSGARAHFRNACEIARLRKFAGTLDNAGARETDHLGCISPDRILTCWFAT